MDVSRIKVGKNPPEDVNVLIEIPLRGDPVKYEFDKESGFITVDRVLSVAMHYPCNYGFIPNTLGDDGDPVDALVITELSLVPGCVINCRPVGVLVMEDEAGMDEKLLFTPSDKICRRKSHIHTPDDISPVLLDQITHFFEHYKDLESEKWVKTSGIEGPEKAKELIIKGIKAYKP